MIKTTQPSQKIGMTEEEYKQKAAVKVAKYKNKIDQLKPKVADLQEKIQDLEKEKKDVKCKIMGLESKIREKEQYATKDFMESLQFDGWERTFQKSPCKTSIEFARYSPKLFLFFYAKECLEPLNDSQLRFLVWKVMGKDQDATLSPEQMRDYRIKYLAELVSSDYVMDVQFCRLCKGIGHRASYCNRWRDFATLSS